jgi:tryptophan synthase alpha chain
LSQAPENVAAPEASGASVSPGAERIAAAFASARDQGRAALMPYMMGAYPDQAASIEVATAYADGGADLIELGVPFSDPLADGPVIHAAATDALRNGAHLESVLEVCRSASSRLPVVLMAYSNMILGAGGPADFASRAADAGASGVIVPDLPLGEDEESRAVLTDAGLAVVPLVAPTTPVDRRDRICQVASGFVYVVSDVGTTGERGELPGHLRELVEDIKSRAEVPVAVGFGIGSPAQAAEVGEVADGVIIGSKLVRLVADAADTSSAVQATATFLAETRAALGAGSSSPIR